MFDNPFDATFHHTLMLPDGTQREYSSGAPTIRRFKIPGYAIPYGFEIDGERYAIEDVSESAFDLATARPARIWTLVEWGPRAN